MNSAYNMNRHILQDYWMQLSVICLAELLQCMKFQMLPLIDKGSVFVPCHQSRLAVGWLRSSCLRNDWPLAIGIIPRVHQLDVKYFYLVFVVKYLHS